MRKEMETEIKCTKLDIDDITRQMEVKEKFDIDRTVIVRGMPVIKGENESLPNVNVQIKDI